VENTLPSAIRWCHKKICTRWKRYRASQRSEPAEQKSPFEREVIPGCPGDIVGQSWPYREQVLAGGIRTGWDESKGGWNGVSVGGIVVLQNGMTSV